MNRTVTLDERDWNAILAAMQARLDALTDEITLGRARGWNNDTLLSRKQDLTILRDKLLAEVRRG